jgi:hypothetical protein
MMNNFVCIIVYDYKLDGPGSIPSTVRFLSSPQRPDRLRGPASYPVDTRGSFPGDKAAEA